MKPARPFIITLLVCALLGCETSIPDCPETTPEWLLAPEDSAVLSPPAYGYYFVNADRSIWASAGWAGSDASYLRAGEQGVKTGWFRPAGEELIVTGQRLDGTAASLDAHLPCCYPTRFQASSLVFPTAGCWEITARAEKKELTFTIWVEPEP